MLHQISLWDPYTLPSKRRNDYEVENSITHIDDAVFCCFISVGKR